jgi:hypothetical protein
MVPEHAPSLRLSKRVRVIVAVTLSFFALVGSSSPASADQAADALSARRATLEQQVQTLRADQLSLMGQRGMPGFDIRYQQATARLMAAQSALASLPRQGGQQTTTRSITTGPARPASTPSKPATTALHTTLSSPLVRPQARPSAGAPVQRAVVVGPTARSR